MSQVGKMSHVTWVMGHVVMGHPHRSHGSWVTLFMGHVGHGSCGSWVTLVKCVTWFMGHVGHMGQVDHVGHGSWVTWVIIHVSYASYRHGSHRS